jgi:hypothetical protein
MAAITASTHASHIPAMCFHFSTGSGVFVEIGSCFALGILHLFLGMFAKPSRTCQARESPIDDLGGGHENGSRSICVAPKDQITVLLQLPWLALHGKTN